MDHDIRDVRDGAQGLDGESARRVGAGLPEVENLVVDTVDARVRDEHLREKFHFSLCFQRIRSIELNMKENVIVDTACLLRPDHHVQTHT